MANIDKQYRFLCWMELEPQIPHARSSFIPASSDGRRTTILGPGGVLYAW